MLPGWPLCPGAAHVPAAARPRGPEVCPSVPPPGSWMPLWCPPMKVGPVLGLEQLVWPLSPSLAQTLLFSRPLCRVSPQTEAGPRRQSRSPPRAGASSGLEDPLGHPRPFSSSALGPGFHPPSGRHPRGGTCLALCSAGPAEQAGGPECPGVKHGDRVMETAPTHRVHPHGPRGPP